MGSGLEPITGVRGWSGNLKLQLQGSNSANVAMDSAGLDEGTRPGKGVHMAASKYSQASWAGLRRIVRVRRCWTSHSLVIGGDKEVGCSVE